MAHVGDIKWGNSPCYESSYSDIAEIFTHPSNALNYDPRDSFFVPGDNEFQGESSLSKCVELDTVCEYPP